MSNRIPEKGERVRVDVHRGYTVHQDRPMECRTFGATWDGGWSHGCKCGECGGNSISYPGTVTEVIYWMDNSVEYVVKCDDGKVRRVTAVQPHGDVC